MGTTDFYFSTSISSFNDFASALSKAIGEPVRVSNNRLLLPASLATGRIEFYELNAGIAVMLMDCTFQRDVHLRRMPVVGNEHYKILFNIGKEPIVITIQEGEKVNLSEAVLFSSHTTEMHTSICAGQRLETVQLIFHRSWGMQRLQQNPVPLRVSRLREYANNTPMQFISPLDLRSAELARRMLTARAHRLVLPWQLEGYAYQLVSMFFNSLLKEELDEKRVLSEDTMRIIQLKEQLEHCLAEPLPTLVSAAAMCLMSKTKFTELFRTLFRKNYGAFFLELKMKSAKELLDSGLPVNEVGLEVGYSNPSHFVKVFKSYFKVTPGLYKSGLK